MSDSEQTEAGPKKGGRKTILIVVIVLVAAAAGAGGVWYYMRGKVAAAQAEKVEPEPTGLLDFEPFIVNLNDPTGRRFLRLSMLLVVPDAETVAKLKEEELVMSKIRSALIEEMAKYSAETLLTVDGRTELKNSIATVAKHTGHVDVKDVLFKELVIQ